MDRECASQSARFRKLWDLNHQELGIGGRLHPRLCESPKPANLGVIKAALSSRFHVASRQNFPNMFALPMGTLNFDGWWMLIMFSWSQDIPGNQTWQAGKCWYMLINVDDLIIIFLSRWPFRSFIFRDIHFLPIPWTSKDRPPRYCKAFRIDGNPDRTSFISLEQMPKMVDYGGFYRCPRE